jgi:hypothetical protein
LEVRDGGVLKSLAARSIDVLEGLTATATGDGTVELSTGGSGGGGSPGGTPAVLRLQSIADGGSVLFRDMAPAGTTLEVYRIGVVPSGGNPIGGLTAEVAPVGSPSPIVSTTDKRLTGAPLASASAPGELAFRIANESGSQQSASALFVYEIVGEPLPPALGWPAQNAGPNAGRDVDRTRRPSLATDGSLSQTWSISVQSGRVACTESHVIQAPSGKTVRFYDPSDGSKLGESDEVPDGLPALGSESLFYVPLNNQHTIRQVDTTSSTYDDTVFFTASNTDLFIKDPIALGDGDVIYHADDFNSGTYKVGRAGSTTWQQSRFVQRKAAALIDGTRQIVTLSSTSPELDVRSATDGSVLDSIGPGSLSINSNTLITSGSRDVCLPAEDSNGNFGVAFVSGFNDVTFSETADGAFARIQAALGDGVAAISGSGGDLSYVTPSGPQSSVSISGQARTLQPIVRGVAVMTDQEFVIVTLNDGTLSVAQRLSNPFGPNGGDLAISASGALYLQGNIDADELRRYDLS